MIELAGIEVYYGRVYALKGIDLMVNEGEIVSLIGANGAGKTTILNTISGLLRPVAGTIRFRGQDIARTEPHRILTLGIAQVPEGRNIFPDMTVHENLLLGAYQVRDDKLLRERLEQSYALFPRLAERQGQLGGTLSGGEQQMLAISRGLMSGPRLLLLDEPSLGLAPLIIKQMVEAIRSINAGGTTVLLVEQNARMALRISHRGYVLETGKVVLSDTGARLLENDRVRAAYLGQ